MKKVLIFFPLIITPLLIFSYSHQFINSKDTQKIIEVTAVPVKKGNIALKVRGRGRIVAGRKEEFKIKGSQKIERLWVKEGDVVDEGQMLLTLTDDELRQKEKEIEAEILRLKALLKELNSGESAKEIEDTKRQIELSHIDYNRAKRELELSEELFKAKAISQRQNEETEAQLKKAKLQHDNVTETLKRLKEKQKLEREITKINYEKTEMIYERLKNEEAGLILRSPFKGRVVSINRDGAKTNEAMGDILTIADIDNLEVIVLVNTYDIVKIKKRQTVEVSLEEYGKTIRGEVRTIGMEVIKQESYGERGNPNIVEVKADLKDPFPQKVKIGTEVEVEIFVDEHREVILIPMEAVLEEDGKTFVFIAQNGIAVKREVEAGISDTEMIEVKKGLTIGEKVITRGNISLKGGEKVSWR